MLSKTHRRVVWFGLSMALVGGALLMRATGAGAADSTTVNVTRIFTGPDGVSHSEVVRLSMKDILPTRQQTDTIPVSAMRVVRYRPGYVKDWHPAEQEQYIVTLSGRGEVELSDGTKVAMEPGSIALADDLTGKGHVTRTVGSVDRVVLHIEVPR